MITLQPSFKYNKRCSKCTQHQIGTYQFPAMRKLAINSGDAFILVYSVDNPQSFDDLEQLRQTILAEREQAYLEACASISSTDSASSGLASCSISGGGGISSQSSGLTTPATNTSHNHLPAVVEQLASRERHWSLASLFNVGHNHNHSQNASSDCDPRLQHAQALQFSNTTPHSRTSLSSSICSSTCSLTNDNSRRSSISAAEAALKTRRTRYPPMVIVANKHDLPEEQQLVDSDEIEALAVIDWNNGFIRASAATNYNINEIFQQVLKQAKQPPTLAEAIISKRRKSLPPKLPNSTYANKSQS